MNSKTEDFPTPVSPTRRTVYGALALCFDILMVPFLRDSTSVEGDSLLEKTPYLEVIHRLDFFEKAHQPSLT